MATPSGAWPALASPIPTSTDMEPTEAIGVGERLFATTPSGRNYLSDFMHSQEPIDPDHDEDEADLTAEAAEDYRLSTTHMTGSLHELQEDAVIKDDKTQQEVAEVMQRSMEACQINPDTVSRLSSPRKRSSASPALSPELDTDDEDDDDDDDDFEDAQESLSPSQKRLESQSSSVPDPGIMNSPTWRQQRKHVFVLSESGKPIFSQHGDEDELASLMAVMQAMVSYVIDMGDVLKSMSAGGKQIAFLHKGPLILVAVTQGNESASQLAVQLTYVYHQILSILTLGQLTRIFERKPGFDLRKMLAGSERLIQSLVRAMDSDPSFMLSAVRVLPLAQAIRDDITKTVIQSCQKIKNLVFAIMIADNKLVALIRMKKYYIHPADLHLLLNLVNTTESFKHSEAWLPICLPKFDPSGFVHAHISYLSDDCQACLLMITAERDIFFEVSEAKGKIVEVSKDQRGHDQKQYSPAHFRKHDEIEGNSGGSRLSRIATLSLQI
ncbi:vacuolar fusion protein MON1 homolog A-like isoform X2 [Tigriopus californicus]|uniref:vacuolar fusion protein MON1 homolog A-like isoform X2 n=1 Tax=Tigriopus californicus TaxID=6832 RepID=UPI0027DA758E|nr:vacuolar fusion protein MON1 homolog A-like isoform X2 [Tigriopus californicus]